jgi:hypothetical protein
VKNIAIIYRKKDEKRFGYMRVSERQFDWLKKQRKWEAIEVKGYIDGMIKSDVILAKERENER